MFESWARALAKAKVGAIAIVAPIAGVVVAIIGYVKQPEPSATTHSGLPETAYVAHCIKRGVNPGGRDLDCQPLFLFAFRSGCALTAGALSSRARCKRNDNGKPASIISGVISISYP